TTRGRPTAVRPIKVQIIIVLLGTKITCIRTQSRNPRLNAHSLLLTHASFLLSPGFGRLSPPPLSFVAISPEVSFCALELVVLLFLLIFQLQKLILIHSVLNSTRGNPGGLGLIRTWTV